MNKKAFTLIEIIVVVTLIFIISLSLFTPYSYFQKKIKIKQTKKEISQLMYETRNLAINGVSDGSNLSVAAYFDIDTPTEIKLLSYPYSFTGAQITNVLGPDIKILTSLELQPGIELTSISGNNNGLFFFNAIHGEGEYYYWDSSNVRNDIATGTEGTIDINFGFRGAITGPLSSSITYYKNTNISDY